MKSLDNNIYGIGRNNFDLLRLVFALMVCLVHMAELSALDYLEVITRFISSSLAVKSFFVISGFLIVRSFHATNSLRQYFEKRFFRIYPAYLFVVVFTALLLMLASSKFPSAYFSIDWLRYVFFNLIFLNFLQPSLPGVYDELRITAVNGALWTLKIEVMFYALVPFIAFVCSKFHRLKVLLIFYFLSISYYNLMIFVYESTGKSIFLTLSQQLPGQLSFFVGGILIYYYYEHFKKYRPMLLLFIGALGLMIDGVLGVVFFEPIALSLLVLTMATFRYFGNYSKYGDFSYGLYIIHFPIIQTLLMFGVERQNPFLFVVSSLLLIFIGSFLLWHCVEKHFLTFSSHYA